MKKLLQICIPTYNRKKYILKQIERVTEEITKYSLKNDVQIIVRDDGSDNNVFEILKKKHGSKDYITLKSNGINKGLSYNLFQLLCEDSARYTMILSDDDFFVNGGILKIINCIKKNDFNIAYLNYQGVQTIINKNIVFKKIKSVILPGFKIKEDVFFKSRHDFFNYLPKLGIHNLRIMLGQQSVFICKSSILISNFFKIAKASNIDGEFYPHARVIWHSFPKNNILLMHHCLVNITINNRDWNADIIEANKMVQKYFDPLQKWILQRYAHEMFPGSFFLLLSSYLYSKLIPIVFYVAKLIGLKKYMYKIQFS